MHSLPKRVNAITKRVSNLFHCQMAKMSFHIVMVPYKGNRGFSAPLGDTHITHLQ